MHMKKKTNKNQNSMIPVVFCNFFKNYYPFRLNRSFFVERTIVHSGSKQISLIMCTKPF